MKYFRMSYREIVFERSYINIVLLNRSIPSYKSDRDEEEKEEPKIEKGRGKTKKNEKFRDEGSLFMSLM